MAIEPGTQLAHYEILSPLGKGGMGEVWRARDTKLGREVAIKTLPEEFATDADRLARFEREAKLLASLNHPNIAAIYGLEVHEGVRFLVLELVEGPTLGDRIKQGAIPVEESLKLALQIAEALEAAHGKGVIHRDLKPDNIKVTPEGKVKVLDFGLSKTFEGDGADVSVSNSPTLSMAATQAGMILGTAAYMSPEQASGETTDHRADVWAFGVVLFEMLTGRQLFTGKTASHVMGAVLNIEPDWNSLPTHLHPRIRTLLERSLEKEAKDRLAGISDARVDVQKVLADPNGVLTQPGAPFVQAPPYSKLPWVAAVILGMFVTGVAVWNLSPLPEPGTVGRFYHVLPEDQAFTRTGRPFVVLSPDGSRIVYVANGQLYSRAMDTLESNPIPGTDEDPVAPFFSPDGQSIGYWAASEGQLKKIAVGGGAPVTLSGSEIPLGNPHWGTDGRIVWGQTEGLLTVSENGGTPEVLVPAAGVTIGEPQILPGAGSVLFGTSATGGEVGVASLETEERKVLFSGDHPTYVSTGHILYGLDDVLFAVPFDLATLEVVGGPVPMVEGVRGAPPQYAVSDSGSLVYVPGGVAAQDRILALVNREGVMETLNVPPKQYTSPRLSPDGQKLAVESIEDSGNLIWVYDLVGNRAIQQLTFEGDNQRPVWTPDSQRITFSSDRDGTMSLYWMPADGSGVAERLTTAEEGTSHWMGSWFPDGDTLVFNIQRELQTDWDIWTLSLDDGETESLYDMPGTAYFGPELSPDGRWLAFGEGPNSSSVDIYVEPFPPTGARRRISQFGGYWPLWAPEGSELFYRPISNTEGITLRSVDIVTEPNFGFSNEQTLPIQGFSVVGYHRDYDLTPDGQRLLMVFPEDSDDSIEAIPTRINIVLNFFEELRERVPVP